MDTIGVWSEKCRHQPTSQPANQPTSQPANQPTSQPITTRHKICEFFEKHKAICITTGILCLPLGIAYATTYGVAKALTKHHQKPLFGREATAVSDNPRANDTESSSSDKEVHKTPFSETTTINSEIENIEKQYEQYAQNPQCKKNKQNLIKALKNSNPCAVYRFLVKLMPSEGINSGPLPQNLAYVLNDPELATYKMFADRCQIDAAYKLEIGDVINTIQAILNNQDNYEYHVLLLQGWYTLSHGHSSTMLLACNAFTDKELEIICNCDGISNDFKTLANDLIALRSFINKMNESELESQKFNDCDTIQFSGLLHKKQSDVSNECLNFFEQLDHRTNDNGQCALQILIEQELMIRNKN